MIPVGHLSYCQTCWASGRQQGGQVSSMAAEEGPSRTGAKLTSCSRLCSTWLWLVSSATGQMRPRGSLQGRGEQVLDHQHPPPVSAAGAKQLLDFSWWFYWKATVMGRACGLDGWWHMMAVICCQCNQVRVKRSGPPAAGHLTLSKVSRLTGFRSPVSFGGHCSPRERGCDGAQQPSVLSHHGRSSVCHSQTNLLKWQWMQLNHVHAVPVACPPKGQLLVPDLAVINIVNNGWRARNHTEGAQMTSPSTPWVEVPLRLPP